MAEITFKKVGIDWWVYVGDQKVGSTRSSGATRGRAWAYRSPSGIKGQASSRRAAAELLVDLAKGK